jgi:cell division transport system permease protein
MIRAAYIMREIGRDLWRNLGTVLASLLSLTLLFLLFDLFWIASGTADRFYKDLLSDLRVEVFVDEAVPDSSLVDVSLQLVGIEGVIDYEYISRNDARRRLAEMVGTDLLVGYDSTNPLPRSYVLKVDEVHRNGGALAKMEESLRDIDGLSEIHYSREWLDKAEQVKGVFLQIGLVLGVLTIAGALIGSANNMRLMTRAQAVGFRQKLLLGASRLFVALPSLAESFLISGLAAVFGWALVFYGRTKVGFARIDIIFPAQHEIVLFCFAVALLGAIAGLLGLRKMLRD